MDVTNEAKIGPSIAFTILFCKSLSHLRHQILVMLHKFKKCWKNYLSPSFSLFNPSNPQGMVLIVSMMVFLLRRYKNVKTRAEIDAAKVLDKAKEADLYDEELVRNKFHELRFRRQEWSIRDMMFYMRADLIRNLGNMCNPELYNGRLHVPKLIQEYIDEVKMQLKIVCDSDSEEVILLEEKLAFMRETRHAFGRTALLLSGGASLGAFHLGVVKTLVEQKLLPRIIAGSSSGSAMCAIVGTSSFPELQSFFEDSFNSLQFFEQMGGVFAVFDRIKTKGAVHDIRQMQMMLRRLTKNLTFQEAYDKTGRILGITVCSPRKHEPPRCLNYLTSPHVVIWSAVTASCAFPGLFEAQELMAKDRSGNIVPYHPPFHLDPGFSTRRWRDGSLEIDLPIKQLKELFNVNHFIVSQANPHIAPLLRLKQIVRTYGGKIAAKIARLAEMEVKHICNQILELSFPLGRVAKLFAQDWEGDITIFMPVTLDQLSKAIQNPSYVDLQNSINQGRRCTWEKVPAIKANCAIELALDECVATLKHTCRLKKRVERDATVALSSPTVKFNGLERIPSWNVVARENSSASLKDEGLMADLPILAPCQRADSVDHCSWTMSGGPLMRTNSSKRFVEFVHNLRVDSRMRREVLG